MSLIPLEVMMAIRRFSFVLLVGFLVLLIELAGAYISGSRALLADAMHVLQDNAFVLLALVVELKVSSRSAGDKANAYRSAAWLQLSGLAIVSFFILWGGVERLVRPEPVMGLFMLAFAVVGAIGNKFQHRALHGIDTLNAAALRYHIHSDYIQSIAVIVAALAITLTGYAWIDGVITIAIGIWMLVQCRMLFREIRNNTAHHHSHHHCNHKHH